ncbi:MAG: flagellar hook-associated protein 3, partial [Suilimivivens sp.]
MRMTNKIMQNNSLYNINNNKILQDKLSTQMSTQKKITRPSDDPVIAIRALRLRTNVSELKQFYEKNAPDAESWLEVTEKALGTVTTVLTDMSKQANKGANKDLAVEDLAIIVEQMKSLRDEFYSTGNMDYAGRYVFTGYRTDTTMSFTEEVEEMGTGYPSYDITEQVTIDAFDTLNYTNIGKLDGLNKNNYTDTKFDDTKEQEVSNGDIHRMRLAYDKL